MSKDGDQNDFKSRLQKLKDQEPPPLPSGNTSDSALQYRIDTLRGVPEEYRGKPTVHPSVYSGVHTQAIPDDFDATMQQIADGGPTHSISSLGGGVGYLGGFGDPLLASVADASSFIGQNRTLQTNLPQQQQHTQRTQHPSQSKSTTRGLGDTTGMGTGAGTGVDAEDDEEAYLDRILYGEKVPHVKPPSPVSAFRKTEKSGRSFSRGAGPGMGISTSSSLSSQQRRHNIQHERKKYSHNVHRLIQEIETCQDDVVNIYKNVHDIRKKEEQKLRQLYGDEGYEYMMKAIANQRHEEEGDVRAGRSVRQEGDVERNVKEDGKGERQQEIKGNTRGEVEEGKGLQQPPVLSPSPQQLPVSPIQTLPQRLPVGQQQQQQQFQALPPTLHRGAKEIEAVVDHSEGEEEAVVDSDEEAVSMSDEEGNVRQYDNKGRLLSQQRPYQHHPPQRSQQQPQGITAVPSSSSASTSIPLPQETEAFKSKKNMSQEERNAFEYALAGIDDLIYEGNDISTLMQMAQDAAKLEDFDVKQRQERMKMDEEQEKRQALRDLERLQKEEEREKKRYEAYIQEKERQEKAALERKIREQELSRLSDESYRLAQQQQQKKSSQLQELSPQSEGSGSGCRYGITGINTGTGTGAGTGTGTGMGSRPQWDASKSVPVDFSRKNQNSEKNEIRENLSREIDAESNNPDIIGPLFRIPEHLQPYVDSSVDSTGISADIDAVDRIIEREMRKKKLKGRKEELEEEEGVGESAIMGHIGKDMKRAVHEGSVEGIKDGKDAEKREMREKDEEERAERVKANGEEREDEEDVEDVEALALESLLSEDRGFGWGTSHLSSPHPVVARPAAGETEETGQGARTPNTINTGVPSSMDHDTRRETGSDTQSSPGKTTSSDAGAMNTSTARLADEGGPARYSGGRYSGNAGAGVSGGGDNTSGMDIDASLAYLTAHAHATPSTPASVATSTRSTGTPSSTTALASSSSSSSSSALPSSRTSSTSASLYPTLASTTGTTPKTIPPVTAPAAVPPVAASPVMAVKTTFTPTIIPKTAVPAQASAAPSTPQTQHSSPPIASLPQQNVKKSNLAWKSPPHWQKDLDDDEILSFFDDI